MLRSSFTLLLVAAAALQAESPQGYYRFPALQGDTLVFVAEGDLWSVPAAGGTARRLTSDPGSETRPFISPDGKTLAFNGTYEGFSEVYTMPLESGLPVRRTFKGGGAQVAGWTPQGHLLVASRNRSTLPDTQLLDLDLNGRTTPIPLAGGGGCLEWRHPFLHPVRPPGQLHQALPGRHGAEPLEIHAG